MVFLVKVFSSHLWIIRGMVRFFSLLKGATNALLGFRGEEVCDEDKENHEFWDSWGPVLMSAAVHVFSAEQVLHKIAQLLHLYSPLCKKSDFCIKDF